MDPAVAALDIANAGVILANMIESYLARRNGGLCYFGIRVAGCVYKADTGSIMIR
jgi:hypothetical protein